MRHSIPQQIATFNAQMMNVEQLVIENAEWILRKAHCYYNNDFDAEDLAGDTIEKILRNKDRYDNSRSFRPWALVIMHNTYITQFNRRQCVPFVCIDEAWSCFSDYDADLNVRLKHILRIVRQQAARSKNIECVVLYALGYEYAEISKMLGIPKGTVMSRIWNGRKMLAEALNVSKS